MRGLQSIGEALRSARTGREQTLQEAAAATRIRVAYLEALEGEQFGALGGAVYVKGFLRTYATWLGLDPGPLLEAYRGQHGEGGRPVFQGGMRPIEAGFGGFGQRRRPNWFMLGSIAAFVVLIAGLVSLFGSRGPAGRQADVVAPVTSGRPKPPPAAAAVPPTTRPVAGVLLVMRYEDRSWTRVVADGAQVFEGIPAAGERRTFRARRTVELTLGNAGAVALSVNGKGVDREGRSGAVWHGTFTPAGLVPRG